MGNGTKIGLVVVLILGVVVVANLLDRGLDRTPSGREQARASLPENSEVPQDSGFASDLGEGSDGAEMGPGSVPADPNRDFEAERREAERREAERRESERPHDLATSKALGGNRVGIDDPRGSNPASGSGSPELRYDGMVPTIPRPSLDRVLHPQEEGNPVPARGRESDLAVPAMFPPAPRAGKEDTDSTRLDGKSPIVDPVGDPETSTSDTDKKPEEPKTPKISTPKSRTHTVEEGESLWVIAEQYYGKGIHFERIEKANSDLELTPLKPGTKIVIPALTAKPAPEKRTRKPGVRTHKLVEGDTFYQLAVELLGKGARWEEIAKANPGVDPRNLKPGTVIEIPAR